MYAQAAATQTLAAATMHKNDILEEANFLAIMTLPSNKDCGQEEAAKFLRLRRREQLKKLRRRLTEEEELEANQFASQAPMPAYSEQARVQTVKRTLPPRRALLQTQVLGHGDDQHHGEDEGDNEEQVHGNHGQHGQDDDHDAHGKRWQCEGLGEGN